MQLYILWKNMQKLTIIKKIILTVMLYVEVGNKYVV